MGQVSLQCTHSSGLKPIVSSSAIDGPSPGGPRRSDNQPPSLGPLSQPDVPLPRPPVFSMTTKEADAYSKLNVLLDTIDTSLSSDKIRILQRELCDPTFDDFFESLIFSIELSNSPDTTAQFPELHKTAITVIHPDYTELPGDDATPMKLASIRQERLDTLADQIEAKEIECIRQLSVLMSTNPSTSVASVSPSEVIIGLGDFSSDDPQHDPLKSNSGELAQIKLRLHELGRYRSLWQGYKYATNRLKHSDQVSPVAGAPNLSETYSHMSYQHHDLPVLLTSGDGHCFFRALVANPRNCDQMRLTQLLLGEEYKEGDETTLGSFKWMKQVILNHFSKIEHFSPIFGHLLNDEGHTQCLDRLISQYFEQKHYSSGDAGEFADAIPPIIFNALATETNAPQYLIKLRWDRPSDSPECKFMLLTYSGNGESTTLNFDESEALIKHLRDQALGENSKIVLNSGIHYEPLDLKKLNPTG